MGTDNEKIKEMVNLREKTSTFIEKVSTPLKNQYSINIERYLDKFITFPGSLSVVSIFFVSSDLVQSHNTALFGVFLIVSSLLIALNAFRVSINNDYRFYSRLVSLERPMVKFGTKFTQFTRGETAQEELIKCYDELQSSYRKDSKSAEETDDNNALVFGKKSINISFILLLFGILVCFISTISFC